LRKSCKVRDTISLLKLFDGRVDIMENARESVEKRKARQEGNRNWLHKPADVHRSIVLITDAVQTAHECAHGWEHLVERVYGLNEC
jgi:hypothetical protein